jgi:capsular exopolysaccharide synthesis family protein
MMQQDDNVWEPRQQRVEDQAPQTEGRMLNKSGVDINFRRILSVWPYVIIFGLLGFIMGFIYLRYVNVVYSVSTSINIEEKSEAGLGQKFLGSQRDPFNDKVAFFKSPTFASHLVDSLGLNYHSVAKGRFKNKDFYGIIKWAVIGYDSILIQQGLNVPDGLLFSITVVKGGFNYTYGNKKGRCLWGEPFNLNGKYILIDRAGEIAAETVIECYTTNVLSDAFRISREIKINSSPASSIINISYSDVNSKRAIDILNKLIILYNNVIEKDKSLSYSQAIDFIDNRIIPLGRELDSIETALANYKAERGFIGTTANGPQYMAKVRENESQLNQINLLKSTISEVEQFIENPFLKDENLSLMGITDAVLQGNARAYQEARRERDRLAVTQTPNNSGLILAEKQLKQIRDNIDIQLVNYKKQLALIENNYQRNLDEADAMLRATPMQEKELLGKQRMMNVKEDLFLSLLKKKEEAAIAKASVTVDTKVLYPPVIMNAIQTPSRSKVLSVTVLTGLLLPFLFAIMKELLNRKIISKKQLQSMTNIPVLSELEETDRFPETPFVIEKKRRSMFGEQIRTLRTSLNFYNLLDKSTSYIVITSSVSGEGKTFLSINIAKSYSLQGKKVALLEFDLRRPKISKEFNVQAEHLGLSNLLIGKCEPQEAIFHCIDEPDEKLDLFVSGPIPPNPQELISGEYMIKLKNYLDTNYDVVVIDTPPYGMVADAQILGKWADVTLVVTRYQQTIFEQIQDINDWYERKVFKNMGIILNGVRNSGYFGNKYGYYYYRRKYGYGYYTYGYYGGYYGSTYGNYYGYDYYGRKTKGKKQKRGKDQDPNEFSVPPPDGDQS